MADQKLTEKLDQAREHIQDRLIQLNRDIRIEFDRLIEEMPEPVPAAPAAQPPAPSELPKILAAAHNLHQATNQVDLLRILVESCGVFVPRVLLLIKKTGFLHGWSSSGFSEEFVENRLKRVRWAVDDYEELKHVVDHSAPLPCTFSELGEIAQQIEQFDGFVPFKAVFYPLVVKGKVAAVLYIDSGTDTNFDRDPATLLCHVAGLELTLVALKAKFVNGSPAESEAAVPAPKPAALPKPAPAPIAKQAPRPAPAPEPEVDSSFVSRMDPPVRPVARPAAPPPAPEPEPQFDPYAGDFDEPPTPGDFAMPEEPQFEDHGFSFQPPPPAPAPAAAAPVDDDDPSTKKAKRAARVLVSDLLLYNEAAIKAARQHGDLYARLKEDIDRSYQHYQERIADLNTRADRNFFKEEIIRQLANGDPKVLGSLPF